MGSACQPLKEEMMNTALNHRGATTQSVGRSTSSEMAFTALPQEFTVDELMRSDHDSATTTTATTPTSSRGSGGGGLRTPHQIIVMLHADDETIHQFRASSAIAGVADSDVMDGASGYEVFCRSSNPTTTNANDGGADPNNTDETTIFSQHPLLATNYQTHHHHAPSSSTTFTTTTSSSGSVAAAGRSGVSQALSSLGNSNQLVDLIESSTTFASGTGMPRSFGSLHGGATGTLARVLATSATSSDDAQAMLLSLPSLPGMAVIIPSADGIHGGGGLPRTFGGLLDDCTDIFGSFPPRRQHHAVLSMKLSDSLTTGSATRVVLASSGTSSSRGCARQHQEGRSTPNEHIRPDDFCHDAKPAYLSLNM